MPLDSPPGIVCCPLSGQGGQLCGHPPRAGLPRGCRRVREFLGQLGIGSRVCQCPVPHPLDRVVHPLGEHRVRGPTLGWTGIGIHQLGQQGMTESDPIVGIDKQYPRRRARVVGRQQFAGRSRRRRHQQEAATSLRRQRGQPTGYELPQPSGHRQGIARAQRIAVTLQTRRQLQGEHRVAAAGRRDPGQRPAGQREVQPGPQQLADLDLGQALHRQLADRPRAESDRGRLLADLGVFGHEHPYRRATESTRHELQDLGALSIQPLRIVDDDQDRAGGAHDPHQLKGRDPDGELIDGPARRRGAQQRRPERGAQVVRQRGGVLVKGRAEKIHQRDVVGLNQVNAYWTGDHIDVGHNNAGQWITSLDVVGHEEGHAIDQYTPGGAGSEAGLGEGTGDILGAMTESYTNSAYDRRTTQSVRRSTSPGTARSATCETRRSMATPTATPVRYHAPRCTRPPVR